ncbi:MAG TPA: cyclic nucleotide-binding domain-containing protein [Anaeromyxobacter sp.]|nr:cyclic nucleotide-binding domain-containing protein [Anaeromyxobacter sp.]
MSVADPVEVLRRVEFLACLEDRELGDLCRRAGRARYAPGQRIIGELEAGADVYVVLEGRAEASVESESGGRLVLAAFEAGSAFGEMSSLTGELHSASVDAVTDVELLVLTDAQFDRLRQRRPEVAVALVKLIGARLAGAERTVEQLLSGPGQGPAHRPAEQRKLRRGSIGRAWRELVVNRRRDLGFLALAGFVATLIVIRASVYLAFRFEVAPRGLLRAAYLSGFALLALSALSALLTFRPKARRVVALAYGIACALIFNELGVTLAFDIFFKDIHTPDPNVPFDVERLYRRTEPIRALVIALAVLMQAAYLRRFYRRAAFVLETRLRRLLARVRG